MFTFWPMLKFIMHQENEQNAVDEKSAVHRIYVTGAGAQIATDNPGANRDASSTQVFSLCQLGAPDSPSAQCAIKTALLIRILGNNWRNKIFLPPLGAHRHKSQIRRTDV